MNSIFRWRLSSRAIENGANAIAEGFLFGVAAALIIGESWRSSRSSAKRRDAVDERLEELSSQVEELSSGANALEARLTEEQDRCVHPVYLPWPSHLYALLGAKD